MPRLILSCIFCLIFHISLAQQKQIDVYKLTVILRGAKFNSLSLRDYRESHNLIISGRNIGNSSWQFTIPDTTVERSEFMELIVPNKDTLLNGYHSIRFYRKDSDIKNLIANIGVQNKDNLITADYFKSTVFPNENLAPLLGKSDTNILGNLIVDDFQLSLKNDDSDIAVRAQEPYFCWFDKKDMSYDQQLESYVQLSKSYPDSRYLITYLSLNLTRFVTREDVKKIYSNFSQQHHGSKWAKRIESYLSDEPKTIKLWNLKTHKEEDLIQDSTKYALLIFSASWCGPCIKEMPLLKTLYDKVNNKINFITISMDYKNKVNEFQTIVNANKNSWRILYAYDKLEKLTDLYTIVGIPLTILVHPNGEMIRIDVRETEVQNKLFRLQ
ncbi:Thiol-disulfide isomerase or thioredoxin [Pedobacter terrae]|uniref:Thiol-disulfide isomerase or thioredoxin n=1 Tax=Pedobacter terrae TaxID=405671 RepID=A0A1G7XFZ0_9SPHI|nr:TlpA disulfide reductase family protein [Pedobacter terrae]SDG82490.1 Thiol-disulfide isomerase or thioredoxin [Pedobacter terrae]